MNDPNILYTLPDDAFIDTRSAAQLLNLEPRSLERLRRERKLPHIKPHHLSVTHVPRKEATGGRFEGTARGDANRG